MDSAVELAVGHPTIGLDDLSAIHRTLMEHSPTPRIGGVVRRTQNWIGGSSYNPCAASFVPAPPDHLDALLDDLLRYVNGDEHPALVPGAPVLTVESAARLIDRSEMRAGDAINRLTDAGVLRQRNLGRRRYRVFEAADIIELFTGLERSLASPPATPPRRRRSAACPAGRPLRAPDATDRPPRRTHALDGRSGSRRAGQRPARAGRVGRPESL